MSATRVRHPGARIAGDAVRWLNSSGAGGAFRAPSKPWTCPDCRRVEGRIRIGDEARMVWRRHFSSTVRLRDEKTSETRKPIDPILATTSTNAESSTPASSSTSLPSHSANQRSQLSKRASKILDELLVRASLASQHINAYTGTDYSGIEALRREIIEQEQKVRSYHTAVDEAKSKHHEAYAKQTSAQREIVGLLERKSNWSPADLERYMSLVRSEHLNDQDVQAAKDNLAAAERSLEDARSLMERLERKQYHEEQVWSDTIRRNSTWVTFGLMGVNILLLLAQIAIFEPYRRKKIVRDVKSALDEKTVTAAPAPSEVEKQVDAAVPPQGVTLEQVEATSQPLDAVLPPTENDIGKASLSAGVTLPTEASELVAPKTEAQPIPPPSSVPTAPTTTWEKYQAALHDLFSERMVQMRKVDVTNAALQGAATGVAAMGLLFLLLRPK